MWVLCSQLSSHLEALVLSHNRITENAGKVLGPAISENTSLRELDLSWNLIRGRGTKQFADGVGVRSPSILTSLIPIPGRSACKIPGQKTFEFSKYIIDKSITASGCASRRT